MTELRQNFIRDLQLRNFSERTVEAYVRAVRQLAQHFNKPPDSITEEELKEYEGKILGAEEKILSLETKLFNDLVLSISAFTESAAQPIKVKALFGTI